MSVELKSKFGFVILHYMATEMTIEAVDQLLKNFSDFNIEIVIVDNASPNQSGVYLKKHYSAIENVSVLLNKTNLGFANGNNVGADYLERTYSPDFMIVLNNDVLIEQSNFLVNIVNIDSAYHFDVLGPDIYNPITRRHQSPLRTSILTSKDFKMQQALLKKQERLFEFYYYRHLTLGKVRDAVTHQKSVVPAEVSWKRIHENVPLHGACYIFSRHYLDSQPSIFSPKTFLYYEEEILFAICQQEGLKILYDPEVQVCHLEDVATNIAFQTKLKRAKMKNHEMLKSINVLLDLLDHNNDTVR